MPRKSLIITGGRIVTPETVIEDGFVAVEGGRILDLGAGKPARAMVSFEEIPAHGRLVLPGFIDVHLHGGGGASIQDGTCDSVVRVARTHARYGTTGFLATTFSGPEDELLKCARAARLAMEAGTGAASVLGVHLEGPYLNPEFCGGQPIEHVRPVDLMEFTELTKASGGNIKMLTLAPEMRGASMFVQEAARRGTVVSAGHTGASYSDMVAAVSGGVSHIAHGFNAMRGFHHREPGVMGAMLLMEQVSVELIVDGFHVSPPVIDLTVRCKGPDGVVLVTDAMDGAGMTEHNYRIGRREVRVKDGESRFIEGGGLAGSALTMNAAVRNIMAWAKVGLVQAVRMATRNPARVLGLGQRKGSIEAGKDADIIITDDGLNVILTMVGGNVVSEG